MTIYQVPMQVNFHSAGIKASDAKWKKGALDAVEITLIFKTDVPALSSHKILILLYETPFLQDVKKRLKSFIFNRKDELDEKLRQIAPPNENFYRREIFMLNESSNLKFRTSCSEFPQEKEIHFDVLIHTPIDSAQGLAHMIDFIQPKTVRVN